MNKVDGKLHRRGGLTLKRKEGEGFKIDENTEVDILKCTDSCVYLSIKAPGRNVLRKEILKNVPRSKVPSEAKHSPESDPIAEPNK